MMQRGISLIEVLLTLSILSFGALSLAGLHGHIEAANTLAAQRNQAVGFAQAKMAGLRMGLLANPAGVPAAGQDSLGPSSSGSLVVSPGLTTRFDRRWTITPDASGDLAVIEITVSWPGPPGDIHTVRLDSLAIRPLRFPPDL